MSRSVVRHPGVVGVVKFHGMITTSPQMLALFEVMKRVAKSSASVLVRGESGTGKELVAKALHALSRRAAHRFRAINCATLTPDLLASELFGHIRGSFTGAIKDRQGLFALAHQGTLFLDEVAEIPLQIQGQLLRVLQEHTFTPVGGSEPVTVDVRILSATNKALREEVQSGRFREDLMYRVRVVPLFLPRLKDREGDIDALTWHFIDGFNQHEERTITGIDPVAMEAMRAYDWPGNVRELRNNIEYAFAIGQGPTLTLSDLTPELKGEPPTHNPTADSDPSTPSPTFAQHRWSQLLAALDDAHGNRSLAAQTLGISRSTLWRRLREGPPNIE